jgi:lysophospholipase L1-like esterase
MPDDRAMTRATARTPGGARDPRRRRLLLVLPVAVLVLVAVLAAVALGSRGVGGVTAVGAASAPTSSVDMAERVSGLEERFASGYPQRSIVLTGSSTIGRWTTSKEDLRPLETYNIGIGGTTVADHVAWLDRMIAPFDPRAVVVYVGANDISGDADSRTGAQTADAVVEYLQRLERAAPHAEVFYVEIAQTPARAQVRDEVRAANSAISAYADTDDRVTFVPTAGALLTADGGIDDTLFVDDGLHFDEAGYERFSEAVRAVVLPALD